MLGQHLNRWLNMEYCFWIENDFFYANQFYWLDWYQNHTRITVFKIAKSNRLYILDTQEIKNKAYTCLNIRDKTKSKWLINLSLSDYFAMLESYKKAHTRSWQTKKHTV